MKINRNIESKKAVNGIEQKMTQMWKSVGKDYNVPTISMFKKLIINEQRKLLSNKLKL